MEGAELSICLPQICQRNTTTIRLVLVHVSACIDLYIGTPTALTAVSTAIVHLLYFAPFSTIQAPFMSPATITRIISIHLQWSLLIYTSPSQPPPSASIYVPQAASAPQRTLV